MCAIQASGRIGPLTLLIEPLLIEPLLIELLLISSPLGCRRVVPRIRPYAGRTIRRPGYRAWKSRWNRMPTPLRDEAQNWIRSDPWISGFVVYQLAKPYDVAGAKRPKLCGLVMFTTEFGLR